MDVCRLGRLLAVGVVVVLLGIVVVLADAAHLPPTIPPDCALAATAPPQVTSVLPADGTENCPIDQVFTVTFDQDMDPSTLLPGALFIFEAGGFPLPATVAYDATTRTATLTPKQKLDAGSTYYVTLGVTVRGASGAYVAGAPLTWRFYTLPPVPPHISSYGPADGAVECPLNQLISVTFDTDMDADTFKPDSFYFAREGGYPLPAVVVYDQASRTATLVPGVPLMQATRYNVTLTSYVRGNTGAFVIGTPIVWTFTTVLVQPPYLTDHFPADGAQDLPLDLTVTATFDLEIDRDTITPSSFFLKKSDGTLVDANLTCNGNIATLTPAIHLDPETTYQVTVTDAVKNVKGARVVNAPTSWTFKTKKVPLPFTDIGLLHPYFTAIFHLAERKVIGGFPDGTFQPLRVVTRQQFAKMIVRALGYEVSENSICPFTDVFRTTQGRLVDPSDPLYPDHYVTTAADHGIILGKTATTFAPYENISRFQAITMVIRAIDDLDRSLLQEPPSPYQPTWSPGLSAAHSKNARLAEFNGLLAGIPLQGVDPLAPMTRGEIAQLEWNVLNFLGP